MTGSRCFATSFQTVADRTVYGDGVQIQVVLRALMKQCLYVMSRCVWENRQRAGQSLVTTAARVRSSLYAEVRGVCLTRQNLMLIPKERCLNTQVHHSLPHLELKTAQ